MAHEEYTGKSGGSSVTLGAAALDGWQQITITESGRPAARQLNKTHAGDTAYTFVTDPLGAEGAPSCEVKIEGLKNVTDHQDSGIFSKALDSTANLVIKKAADGDQFTMANAILRARETSVAFADVTPFSVTFALDASAGAWATAS